MTASSPIADKRRGCPFEAGILTKEQFAQRQIACEDRNHPLVALILSHEEKLTQESPGWLVRLDSEVNQLLGGCPPVSYVKDGLVYYTLDHPFLRPELVQDRRGPHYKIDTFQSRVAGMTTGPRPSKQYFCKSTQSRGIDDHIVWVHILGIDIGVQADLVFETWEEY